MARKLLNDCIVRRLGKICRHTETSDRVDTSLYSIVIVYCHIIAFPDKRNKNTQKLPKLGDWLEIFSVIVSITGNAALQADSACNCLLSQLQKSRWDDLAS